MRPRTAALTVSVMLQVWSAPAQEFSPPDSARPATASLTILTDVDGASVFLNGVREGETPLTLDTLPPGTYSLLLVHPDPGGWLTRNMRDTFFVDAGGRKTLRYRLRGGVLVNSTPSGATLRLDDTTAGITPFILRQPLLQKTSFLSLTLEGYEPVTIPVSSISGGGINILLQGRWSADRQPGFVEGPAENGGSRTFPAVASGIGAILAGGTAAYFKIKADDRNEAYARTGNPALLAERNRYDRTAALSLVAMQVGIGLLMYQLLSD